MISFKEIKLNAAAASARGELREKAQEFLDSEILRTTEPFVPLLTGALVKSGTIATAVGSGTVKYSTPYAKRQYYTNKGAGRRGKLWFERSKAQNKAAWLAGAEKILKGR
jgi:hypothetical protein